LAALARAHSGCEVFEQNFLDLKLPSSRFDGVFANASLFHVPSQVLPQVLRGARRLPNGVLSAEPRGAQRMNGDRDPRMDSDGHIRRRL
jgi:hypothetical protein